MKEGGLELRWVFFDLNGTLLNPGGVGEPLRLGHEDSLAALDDAVLQAMADTLTGTRRDFPEYLRAALSRRALLARRDAAGLDEAMERAAAMPPFPDASQAIDRLVGAGLQVGVLTNSARDAAEGALEAAELAAPISIVIGADEAGAYKPDPRVYRLAAERTGEPPDAICLIAAHGWDVLGAKRAGLRAGWVARKERILLDTFPEPDVRGESLLTVAAVLAGPAQR